MKLLAKNHSTVLWILRLASFAVFFGRGWQHVFWDAPYRDLLWDQTIMEPLVSGLFGLSWYEYATHPSTDHYIQSVIRGVGLFYFVCAFLSLWVQKHQQRLGALLIVGSLSLAFLAGLYYKEHFFYLGQLLEYTLQIITPLLLYGWLYERLSFQALNWVARIGIALTFTCHGLYAVGYYPTSVGFMEMTMGILGVDEAQARLFLLIAGILDFLVSILIFIPKVDRIALIYAVVWGALTALARIVTYFSWEFPLASMHQWMHETIMRLPHALIPLFAFMITFLFVKERTRSTNVLKTTEVY